MNGANISTTSLLIASSLILVTLIFSYWQKLQLGKETVISAIRAVVQLVILGYILEYIFGLENPVFTTLLLLAICLVAAVNASKKGKAIKNGLLTSFVAIATGAIITITVLVLSGAIDYAANQAAWR